MMELLMPWIVPAAGVIALLLILAGGYVKAPPDQAYIISGLKKDGKILIGRAGIRIPFFERLDRLYLGQMTVDINTEDMKPRFSPGKSAGFRKATVSFFRSSSSSILLM